MYRCTCLCKTATFPWEKLMRSVFLRRASHDCSFTTHRNTRHVLTVLVHNPRQSTISFNVADSQYTEIPSHYFLPGYNVGCADCMSSIQLLLIWHTYIYGTKTSHRNNFTLLLLFLNTLCRLYVVTYTFNYRLQFCTTKTFHKSSFALPVSPF